MLPRLAADIADRALGGIFRRHRFLSDLRSPSGFYDEPKILPHARISICPMVADFRQQWGTEAATGQTNHPPERVLSSF